MKDLGNLRIPKQQNSCVAGHQCSTKRALAAGGDIQFLTQADSEHGVKGFYTNKQSFMLVLYLAM